MKTKLTFYSYSLCLLVNPLLEIKLIMANPTKNVIDERLSRKDNLENLKNK